MFTNQVWFPKLMKILIRSPVKLPVLWKSVHVPDSLKVELNLSKMQPMECFISENIRKTLEFWNKFLVHSWQPDTRSKYQYIKQWECFCSRRGINALKPTVNNVLDFFHTLFKLRLGYSAIDPTRSAVIQQLSRIQSEALKS